MILLADDLEVHYDVHHRSPTATLPNDNSAGIFPSPSPSNPTIPGLSRKCSTPSAGTIFFWQFLPVKASSYGSGLVGVPKREQPHFCAVDTLVDIVELRGLDIASMIMREL